MRIAFALIIAALYCTPATAQQNCPATPAVGTSNTTCANTAFVQRQLGAITYTPPGTGGVATTVQSRLNRTIYANDYGAVCNGSTDDSTAFQNAINEAQTLGVPLRWIGSCSIGTGLQITEALDFGGTGGHFDNQVGIFSQLISGTNNMTVININTTTAVNLHDFEILAGSATGVTGINLTAPTFVNTGSIFRNVTLTGGLATCFNTGAAANWTIDAALFNGCLVNSIVVQDTFAVDSGDGTIVNSTFSGTPTTAHIDYLSAGGLRINNDKINGATPVAILLNLVSGATTADLFLVGNSIEGANNSVIMQRQGTGSFANVIISSNEMSSAGTGGGCVVVPSDTAWLSLVVISNNVCVGTATGSNAAFNFNTPVSGLNITNNSVLGQGSTNFAIITGTQTATDCTVGMITKRGTFNASVVSSCTVVGTD